MYTTADPTVGDSDAPLWALFPVILPPFMITLALSEEIFIALLLLFCKDAPSSNVKADPFTSTHTPKLASGRSKGEKAGYFIKERADAAASLLSQRYAEEGHPTAVSSRFAAALKELRDELERD